MLSHRILGPAGKASPDLADGKAAAEQGGDVEQDYRNENAPVPLTILSFGPVRIIPSHGHRRERGGEETVEILQQRGMGIPVFQMRIPAMPDFTKLLPCIILHISQFVKGVPFNFPFPEGNPLRGDVCRKIRLFIPLPQGKEVRTGRAEALARPFPHRRGPADRSAVRSSAGCPRASCRRDESRSGESPHLETVCAGVFRRQHRRVDASQPGRGHDQEGKAGQADHIGQHPGGVSIPQRTDDPAAPSATTKGSGPWPGGRRPPPRRARRGDPPAGRPDGGEGFPVDIRHEFRRIARDTGRAVYLRRVAGGSAGRLLPRPPR